VSTVNPLGGPLKGIKVLDLSRILAAPWAAQMLSDLGADVIKVERPVIGDDARRISPFLTNADGSRGESMFYLAANRGKRSITIDLSQPAGQDLVRKLAATSDVFIENFKAGDLKRYGLDYESIRAINPRIVYCSVTGYGQTGPYAPRPGYDAIFQAMSGIMSTTGAPTGEKGEGPTKVGVSLSDVLAGLFASSAICAALVEQRQSGQGRYIDVALLDSSFATLSHLVQWYLCLGEVPPRRGS
jgi:crotonobetainyl-CoA:carnitine CoA-transferase CaiB-like acyl-CoA transferase